MSFDLAQFHLGAGLRLVKLGGTVLRGQGGPFEAFILRGQGLDV